MSNYVKATDFASKDALLSGNPSKIIKGTEIDTEFNSIATAIQTKADLASPTFTGTPSAPTAVAGTNTTQLATTAFVTSANTSAIVAERDATVTLTNKTLTSPTINGGSISGITDLAVADGGTGASTITANSVILGNGTGALSGNLVAPGTSGNILTSNGTTWTSATGFQSGSVVKTANFQTGSTTSYSSYTAIPLDATIPQNTEGAQAMSLSYAMTNASNSLDIQVIVYIGAANSGRYLIAALFSSASSSAIATAYYYEGNNGSMIPLILRTRISPGTTSSRTYTVRVGDNGGGTVAINGDTTGVNYFGGVLYSGIYIQEIKA